MRCYRSSHIPRQLKLSLFGVVAAHAMVMLHRPKNPVDQWPKELSLPAALFLQPPSRA